MCLPVRGRESFLGRRNHTCKGPGAQNGSTVWGDWNTEVERETRKSGG